MGLVVIQDTSRDLNVVIEVAFLIVGKKISTLLSMKDMSEIYSDIFIQRQLVSLGSRRHRLTMERYLRIDRQTLDDLPYDFNKEQKLRALHSTVSHLYVKALETFLQLKNEQSLMVPIMRPLEKIKYDYIICMEVTSSFRKIKRTIETKWL